MEAPALDSNAAFSNPRAAAATQLATNAALKAEMDRLIGLDHDALRVRWIELFGQAVSHSVPSNKLARAIAYRLQAAYHGVDDALIHSQGAFQISRLTDGVGAPVVLRRYWKGQDHEVTREGAAFVYNGTQFSSLSAVARAITGTRWNGWTFFGLRSPSQSTVQSDHG